MKKNDCFVPRNDKTMAALNRGVHHDITGI